MVFGVRKKICVRRRYINDIFKAWSGELKSGSYCNRAIKGHVIITVRSNVATFIVILIKLALSPLECYLVGTVAVSKYRAAIVKYVT